MGSGSGQVHSYRAEGRACKPLAAQHYEYEYEYEYECEYECEYEYEYEYEYDYYYYYQLPPTTTLFPACPSRRRRDRRTP